MPFADSISSELILEILLVGHGISIGISVGIAQVLVLRQHIPSWRLWWAMVALGHTLGGTIALHGTWPTAGVFLDISWDSIPLIIRGLCFGAVGGLIYGSITVIALKSLRPRQNRL